MVLEFSCVPCSNHCRVENLWSLDVWVCDAFESKLALRDLAKAPNVAYNDILNNFDLTWRVKGLIETWSNLVGICEDRPQMSIIS